MDAIRRSTITFGVGPAGTGKTFLAIAMAVAALSKREVNRIILTRPAVEAGERLGFLPGDLMAKVDPYLRPLFDALHDMLDAERVAAHLERAVIEVAPLAFMRGRTLNDSFVILDEAQNTSPEQMKMFLTRLGLRLEDGRDRRHHPGRPPARPEVGPDRGQRHPHRRRGHRVHPLRRRGRRAAQARPADRRRLRRARAARRTRAAPGAAAQAPHASSARGRGHRLLRTARGVAAAPRRDRARVGGRRGRPPRGRVRRRRADRGAQRRAPRRRGPDRRALVPGRPRRAGGRAAGDRRRRDLPRAHRATCPRPSSTARCTSSGMDHETDRGEMLALQAEIVSWVR